MVQDDPSKRPNIEEVVRRFEESVRRLRVLKLRSRVVSKTDSSFEGLLLSIPHWMRRISYIVRSVAAIPKS